MRAKTFGAFATGFAVGVVAVGLGLWGSGTLKTAHMPPWVRPDAPQTVVAPAVLDTASASTVPPAPVPPPETPPAPPTTTGSADRVATESSTMRQGAELRLAMPLANVDPKTLTDQFQEARGGGSRKHEAIDILSPRGTPVLAVAEGNVAKLFTSKDGGLTVYQFGRATRSGMSELRETRRRTCRICISRYSSWGRRNSGGRGRRSIRCRCCARRAKELSAISYQLSALHLRGLRAPDAFGGWAFWLIVDS
jgi:hypothetical protein